MNTHIDTDETRIESYIDSLSTGTSELLSSIEREALNDEVPIIRKGSQCLLEFLIKAHKPERILEVGTAVGFSALLMWEASDKKAKITTIENYEKRIPIAWENFNKAGAGDDITLIEGDAMEILKTLDGPYPFIFMDAAKAQYINFLPEVTRLLTSGGILVTDNVLQDGDVLCSRYGVTRRDRTIHSRMREYLHELTHNDLFTTSIVNVGDGMALTLKK